MHQTTVKVSEGALDRFLAGLDQVNPSAETLQVSARSGEGIEAWREQLLGLASS
jgi:hypothetical protein